MAGEYERGIDVGCGSSIILEALPNVVGVDAAQAPLRFLAGHSSRDLVRASADALPFATGAFDLGLASRLLERVPDPAAALRELARVIRPGGRLVVATPDADHPLWAATGWLTAWLAPAAHGPAARLGVRALADLLRAAGFEPGTSAHVGGGELVVEARRT
jgi:ubiquinone/menaquinone biosynthesis C-methylase UbiE